MDPDSGFTSVRVGADSPSVLGGALGWLRGMIASSGAHGTWGGTSGGELHSNEYGTWCAYLKNLQLVMVSYVLKLRDTGSIRWRICLWMLR
jgi:hypothetical protein